MRAVLHALFGLSLGAALALGTPQSATSQAKIVRLAPEADTIIPAGARIEQVATIGGFSEGPVWIHAGYLLFSDIPGNAIMKWTPDGKVTVFRKPSGYDGNDAPAGAFIGSNGLTLDREGRLVICEHGNRRVTRLEKDGTLTILADRYHGKRLNSPNDVIVSPDDAIYFTDPPHGLAKEDDDPAKELKFNGVYRLAGKKLQLLTTVLERPNGLAFSPGQKYLYVGNSFPQRRLWMRFEVQPDGSLAKGKIFINLTNDPDKGSPDGMKVDKKGNLYATGPGGLWIITPQGKHLATIVMPNPPANCAWGDEDGKTLYITAVTGIYRVRLNIEGIRP
jgi:gluconolactonase